jgi:hypothetical protein
MCYILSYANENTSLPISGEMRSVHVLSSCSLACRDDVLASHAADLSSIFRALGRRIAWTRPTGLRA